MSRDERPLASAPRAIVALLAALLAGQVAWHALRPTPGRAASDLPVPPSGPALRAASLGEHAAAARLTMIWLQGFDLHGGNATRYADLDYERLIGWLRSILEVDPRSAYPLFAGARVYAEVADERKARRMLEFVHAQFMLDPNRRWPALAHAAYLAKHRLKDLPLARRYAADLNRHTRDRGIPLWAKQMEIFILEDMNELEAAKVMLGGLLASGRLRDPWERKFLEGRLRDLEARLGKR